VVAGGVEPGLPLSDWSRDAGLDDALVVTGRLDLPDFVRHLCAADVVLALRFPSYGEMSGALVRALGVGRPALVTAGTPAAEEFPEGVVAVVDPGPAEPYELEAVVGHLLSRPQRAEAMGREAAAYVRAHHDLERTTAALAAFLADVAAQAPQARSALLAERAADSGRLGFFLDEVRPGARELGLSASGLGIEALLGELAGGAP
jgi:glycosyltransferase involved in cell wall biosynthesis